jgi:hypothetical protein
LERKQDSYVKCEHSAVDDFPAFPSTSNTLSTSANSLEIAVKREISDNYLQLHGSIATESAAMPNLPSEERVFQRITSVIGNANEVTNVTLGVEQNTPSITTTFPAPSRAVSPQVSFGFWVT